MEPTNPRTGLNRLELADISALDPGRAFGSLQSLELSIVGSKYARA
jgi:hypothetical protein